MLRNSIVGLVVFGVTAAVAGYVWTAFEFPFAILAPAAVGWYAVVRGAFGTRKALWAALLGGVSFTVVFMLAVFLALTDGSPVALSAWLGATIAAGLAGAFTGFLLGGLRGSGAMAIFSAGGMLVATAAMGLLRALAPSSVDVAGQAQYLYFAMAQGVVGALVGAAIGAGVSWIAGRNATTQATSTPAMPGRGTPHGA